MSNTIEISHVVEFPPHWPLHGIDTIYPKPLVPTPFRLISCTDKTFEIDDNLLVGEWIWAQLYRGTLHSSPGSPISDVVLKVYDEGQFPGSSEGSPPLTYSRFSDSGKASRRLSGEIMAWQESWAYEQLKSMQGECIPTFYGVFQVTTKDQSGKVYLSFAIAMSYVEGTDILERCKQLGSWTEIAVGSAEWFPLVRDIHVVTHKMHQLGVAHHDIAPRNILCSASTGSVVFIDFAMCRPSRWATPEDAERHGGNRCVEDDGWDIYRVVQKITGDIFVDPKRPGHKHFTAQQRVLFRWLFDNYAEEPWFGHFSRVQGALATGATG